MLITYRIHYKRRTRWFNNTTNTILNGIVCKTSVILENLFQCKQISNQLFQLIIKTDWN